MGQLIRILVILLALWLVLGFVRQALERRRARRGQGHTPVAEMVRCAHCGVHVPRGEAVEAHGVFFCNEEHRRAGPRS
jgi:uncharacterized protein